MVHQLSDGRRRCLAVAGAPVIEPQVDRLDEPTSAPGLSIRTESPNRLTRPRGEPRLTCLLPSHGLAAAAHMCEEAAVMREVEVVETLSMELTRVDVP
jgi:peptide/nickel transport system ATP-binding protein